jgi:hypothetical protein
VSSSAPKRRKLPITQELLNALKASLANLENVRTAGPKDTAVEELKQTLRSKIAEIERRQIQ